MRTKFLGIAAAVAFCAATMSTDAPAAQGHSHWTRGHFHNGFRHYASVARYSAIGSRRALTFGVWVAAGGPVTTIAADGPMPTAMLPTAVTSLGVGNVIDV
jgi:hypothetical protein